MTRAAKTQLVYWTLLAGAFVVSLLAGGIFAQIDYNAYDYLFRMHSPQAWPTSSAILAIDEPTLSYVRGMSNIRLPLAEGLKRAAAAQPSAVAVDVILADAHDPATDAAMEAALRACPNLVLDSELIENGASWEDPAAPFRAAAAAV